MSDASYQPKVYRKQGGDELVVASGGKITIETGGTVEYNGDDLIAEIAALSGLDATELGFLNGVTAGTVTVSKAAVYDAAGKLKRSSATVAAAGNSLATATDLTAELNAVTGADGTKAVSLPVPTADSVVIVVNTDATNNLPVYPDAAGSQINALGAGNAFTVTPGQVAIFIGRSATLWYVAAATDTITGLTASAAELNLNDGTTAGTVVASKTVAVDAQKAVDTLRATTDRTLGGTGVPAAAGVAYEMTKEVTAIADATATTVLTVTVPNAAHAGMIDVAVIGRLGAGGAIGADEAVSSSRYQFTFVRTAGVASVLTASAQLGAVNVAVAGAATVTATLSVVDSAEGVGATNTHLIKVTITKSGGASANHKCNVHVRLHNCNATGVTIA